jgi:hypothetical protein
MNRLVPYLTLLRQGADPASARSFVQALQVDYSRHALTPIERTFIKRAFPFYSFSKGMASFVAGKMLDDPGSLFGQAVRLPGRVEQREGEFLPEYMTRSGGSIRMSPLDRIDRGQLQKSYLTSLGLMHEDPVSFLRPGQTAGETVKNFANEILGRTNPAIKGWTEWATGRNLFTGREMADSYGPLSRIGYNLGFLPSQKAAPMPVQWADILLGNSPASGWAGMARRMTDRPTGEPLSVSEAVPKAFSYGWPEKILNLITGARIESVGPAAERMALREAIEDRLRGRPGIHEKRPMLYSPAAEEAMLDPEASRLMDFYNLIDRRGRQEAKMR